MFKTIVLATDLSPAWDEIVACAGEFKALGCARVILTHVISVKFMAGMEGMLQATPGLNWRAAAQLEAQGLQVTMEMPMGLPADSLERDRLPLRRRPDRGGLPRQWREGVLGCVTCAVLHNATTPVLLLWRYPEKHQGSCRLHSHELLRHVLFPTIFRKSPSRAWEYIERLAAKGLGQVTVLNALDVPGSDEAYPPGYQEIAEGAARDLLAQWKQRLLQAGIPQVNAHFDPGHPLPAILGVLESQDISLIVMGTQGKGFIKEIFLGSVAHNVSRLATCPVLLIPPASR